MCSTYVRVQGHHHADGICGFSLLVVVDSRIVLWGLCYSHVSCS